MFEITRRHFLSKLTNGIGGAALASLMSGKSNAVTNPVGEKLIDNFAPKAKRIIYLFMSGGPAQQDLFDYKPKLNDLNGQQLPDEVRGGQRLIGMSGNQTSIPLAGSQFKFKQQGQSGAWVSELLPHTATVVDDLCFIKSLWTEAINHDPAMTFFQTGSQIAGRPSLGSWVTYGLGSSNDNLPGFVVLATKKPTDQPLYARLWGTGFLDSRHQGCDFLRARMPCFISPIQTAYADPDAGLCWTSCPISIESISKTNWTRKLKPGSPNMKWPTGCRPAFRK